MDLWGMKKETKSLPLGPLRMVPLSVLVGVIAGLGAVVFRGLIGFFHNLFFRGELSVFYNSNIHTPPSPWGPLVILVPVVGGICVSFLVQTFAPEAKGHGVPEVMDAIYYHKGFIRPVVALIKSLASALSIGSGGSVGREGPIVQIGSSFGSTLGQLVGMPTWQRITLIAAGTGGGIGATFNTPIGGILFAMELMLQEISVKTITPVMISTVTATYIGQIFLGPHPSFEIPEFETPYFHLDNPVVLIFYAGLGALLGVASALFIKSIYSFEDFFEEKVSDNFYVRHILGMMGAGVILCLCWIYLGHYYVEGVGYATIIDILSGTLSQFPLLLLLFGLKLFNTSLTLGSGGSGGIFSPSLYLGATLGGAYGTIVSQVFPGMQISPPAFAVAGMAGMAGGATGAVMAAIVMIFEMTLDYRVILPMAITVAFSYGVRKLIMAESIYIMKLGRRGHYMPESLQVNLHHINKAGAVMNTNFLPVPASKTVLECSQMLPGQGDAPLLLVKDSDRVIGIVTKEGLAMAMLNVSPETLTMGQIVNQSYVTVDENMRLCEVIAKMRAKRASAALVLSGKENDLSGGVKGIILKEKIADSLSEALDLFSD